MLVHSTVKAVNKRLFSLSLDIIYLEEPECEFNRKNVGKVETNNKKGLVVWGRFVLLFYDEASNMVMIGIMMK